MRASSVRSACLGLLGLVLFLAPARAEARNIFLNGIKLDTNVALKPQTLVGCDVRIDEAGDIYITARGYKIESPRGAAAPAAAGARGFWLISKQSQRGVTQYDVDVFINDQLVKKVRSTDDPVVLDVSKYVQNGQNRVRMVAMKNIGQARVSQSPSDTLEVLLGEGAVGGGTVTVDKVLVNFKRNANETQNIREDFTFTAP